MTVHAFAVSTGAPRWASSPLRCWCRSRGRPRAQTLDKLSFHTDWRAQAEHGGYYQAVAAGLYKAAASSATCARAGRASTSASSCSPAGST